jgi:polar amino acid transport system substrate-binding protein
MNDPKIRISVDIGSSQDQIVTRFCSKATISRLNTQDEATVALQTGRADAQCITFFNALPIIKKNPSIGTLLLPTPLMRATSNIGFRRENDKTLREFVDTWISFNTGMGLIREIVIGNFSAIGISEQDFPPGVAI